MPLSDYCANGLLNYLFGKSSVFGGGPPTVYVGLYMSLPTDPSSSGTEAAYTGYARKVTAASDWNVAAGRTLTNANAIAFALCTGGSSSVIGFGLFDALTSGNMLDYGYIVLNQTITGGNLTRSGTTATVSLTAHGYSTGNAILITGCEQPEYNGWQTVTVSDANTFTYTDTNSPATPATASSGNTLQASKATTLAVSVNIQPQFAAGVFATAMQ